METPTRKRQASTPQRPTKARRQQTERVPVYLFHGTPAENFESISKEGLQAKSKGEKGVKPYVSFAKSATQTPVLKGNKPTDIILRVKTRKYKLFKGGAGLNEYRSHEDIQPIDLEYVQRKHLKSKPIPWKRIPPQNIQFV